MMYINLAIFVMVLTVCALPVIWVVHKNKIDVRRYRITPYILEKLNLTVGQFALISTVICATGFLLMLSVMYNGGTESTQAPYINYLIYGLYLIGGSGLTLAVIHEANIDAEDDEHNPYNQ